MPLDDAANVLSTPLRIGKLTLANRVVMAPMAANSPGTDCNFSDQSVAFYEARARGGVSMIIIGGTITSARGYDEAPLHPLLRFDRDEIIPSLKRVVDSVHALNIPIIAELIPAFGRMGVPAPDRPLIAASPKNTVIPEDRFGRGLYVPGGRTTPVPNEATIEEIRHYEQGMIDAAERSYRAGCDGVEIGAHMSYFLASFSTPRTNWRTDEYGGSVENRARMMVNIVSGIRKIVPPDFVVGLRITSNEYLPDGQDAQGYIEVTKRVVAEGVDYVALSPGCYETMDLANSAKDGVLIESGDARAFKQALQVPILLQGIHDPANAEQAIADGHGDAIMLARPLLADPDYARKVVEGRPAAIVRCTRENSCLRRFMLKMPIRCEMNARTGVESRTSAIPPIRRFVQAPVENVLVAATGSERLMGFVGSIAKRAK
jgi:2,4-dienoyl-CoA reductase (NADPH2)